MDVDMTAKDFRHFWTSRFFMLAGGVIFGFFFLGWDYLLFPVDPIYDRRLFTILLAALGLPLQLYGSIRYYGLWKKHVREFGAEKAKSIHNTWVRRYLQGSLTYIAIGLIVAGVIYLIRFAPPDFDIRSLLALLVAVLLGIGFALFVKHITFWFFNRPSSGYSDPN